MRQFNLDEYIANPSRKVVTREGRPVRIVCTDVKDDYPIVGIISIGVDHEETRTFMKNGRYLVENEDVRDLFFAPEKKVIWGNLYSTQHGTTFSGDFYKTEEAALKEKAKDFSKYITTFKVEWEE